MLDASGTFQTPEYAPGPIPRDAVAGSGGRWRLSVSAVSMRPIMRSPRRDLTDVVITFTDKPMALAGSVRAADSVRTSKPRSLRSLGLQNWIANGMSARRVAMAPTSQLGHINCALACLASTPRRDSSRILPEVDPDSSPDFGDRDARDDCGRGRRQALTVSRVR